MKYGHDESDDDLQDFHQRFLDLFSLLGVSVLGGFIIEYFFSFHPGRFYNAKIQKLEQMF